MRKLILCKRCGKKKLHHAFSLCANCYMNNRHNQGIRRKTIICTNCGERKEHHAFNLCRKCYLKENYQKRRKDETFVKKRIDYSRKYRIEHKEEMNLRSWVDMLINKEYYKAKKKEWLKNNRDKDREQHNKWLKKNKERYEAQRRADYHLKKGNIRKAIENELIVLKYLE